MEIATWKKKNHYKFPNIEHHFFSHVLSSLKTQNKEVAAVSLNY